MNEYGGIFLTKLEDVIADGKIKLIGKSPYNYYLLTLDEGDVYCHNSLSRHCVFHLEIEPTASIEVNSISIRTNEYFYGDSENLIIKSKINNTKIILVSQTIKFKKIEIERKCISDSKIVDKPWGSELWLTGNDSEVFAFKKIILKAGFKTSLQYHNYKRETNFVLSGKAKFYYNPDKSIEPENFNTSNLNNITMSGPFILDIQPRLIHRLEAIENLILYEVSTPQLDDVIRILDDSSRTNGRIDSEHVGG